MKQLLPVLLLGVLLNLPVIAQNNRFGNEWIIPSQTYAKITIAEKGIYRLSANDLKTINFSVDNLAKIQLWHYGKEVSIWISGDADGKFDTQDFIEFYAEGNNGDQDSLLYRPMNARMNPYQSLYSDETSYYLTVGSDDGKRIQVTNNQSFTGLSPEKYHLQEQATAFNEQYSHNLSIGYPPSLMQSFYEVGEGWSGKIIVADSLARFSIKLENYLPQIALKPTLECLFNGRTDLTHNVTISIKNNQNILRNLGKITNAGFAPLKITTAIESNEISGDGTIQLQSQSSQKDTREWHSITYHKIIYPQSFDMATKQSKYFYLLPNASSSSYISIPNAPANALVYRFIDTYQFEKIASSTLINTLEFVVNNTKTSQKIFVSNEIKMPKSIKNISFLNTSDKKFYNYLIITHSSLMTSANDYATYRASVAGGSFQPLVTDIQSIFETFGYGERTPYAIRRYVDFLLANGQKIDNLFLIGRSLSHPDYLKTQASSDLVPTIGYPASDNLLTDGLNNFDEDVQAIPTGRLSANTNEQVENYLKKVQEYEANTTDVLWKKNILHLSGGGNKSEISSFKSILNNIVPKVNQSFLAGKVQAIAKKTDQEIENIDISPEVNAGVGMVTFLGHSSATVTDLNIGYVSSAGNKIQNKGKYPFMYFNGCGVGNTFNRYDALVSDWLLTPDKGSVAILANSFWSYNFAVVQYLTILYDKLFSDTTIAGKPIGKSIQLIDNLIKKQGIDSYMLSNIQQLVIHGDPALQLFPIQLPDYQAKSIFIQSKNQSVAIAANDSLQLGFILANAGKYDKNQLPIITIKKNFQGKTETQFMPSKAVAISDTLFVTIAKNQTLQSVDILIDADNKIAENNEKNNTASLLIDWAKANNYTIYPTNALPDKLNPVMDVFFNGKQLKQNDFVATNSTLQITLKDENPISVTDSSNIEIYLKTCDKCTFNKISAKNISQTQKDELTITAQYSLPNLPAGNYKIIVVGKDAQGNKIGNPYEVSFSITGNSQASSMLVYPNPSTDFAIFQLIILDKENPKTVSIEIFDNAGRKIDQLTTTPTVGTNTIYWAITNTKPTAGIYFYKAIVNWQNRKQEKLEGKIIVR